MFSRSGGESWQRSGRLEIYSRVYNSNQIRPLPPAYNQDIVIHQDVTCENFSGISRTNFEQQDGLSRNGVTAVWSSDSNVQVNSYECYDHHSNSHPYDNDDRPLFSNLNDPNNNYIRGTDDQGQCLEQVNNVGWVTPTSFAISNQNGRSRVNPNAFENDMESSNNQFSPLYDNNAKSTCSPLIKSNSGVDIVGNEVMFESIAQDFREQRVRAPEHMKENKTFFETDVSKLQHIPVITLDDDDEGESISVPNESPLQSAIQVSVIKLNKGQEKVIEIVDLVDDSLDSCDDHYLTQPKSVDILFECNPAKFETYYLNGTLNPFIKIRTTVIKRSSDQNNNLGPPQIPKIGMDCFSQAFHQLGKVSPLKESVVYCTSSTKTCSFNEHPLKFEREIIISLQPDKLNFFSMLPFKFLKLCNHQNSLPILSLILTDQEILGLFHVRWIQGFCYLVPVPNKSSYASACEMEQKKRTSIRLYLVRRVSDKKVKGSVNSKNLFRAAPLWFGDTLKLLFKKVNTLDFVLDFPIVCFVIEPILRGGSSSTKEQYDVKPVEQGLKMRFTKKLLSAKNKARAENNVKHFNNLSTKDKKTTMLLAKTVDGYENVGQEPIEIILQKLGISAHPFLTISEVNSDTNQGDPNSLKNDQKVGVINPDSPKTVISPIILNGTDKSSDGEKLPSANSAEPQEIVRDAGTNLSSSTDAWTDIPDSKYELFYREQLMLEELKKISSSDDILKTFLKNRSNLDNFQISDNLKMICQILKQNEESEKNKIVVRPDDLSHQMSTNNQSKSPNPDLKQSASLLINTDSAAQILETNVVHEEVARAIPELQLSKVLILDKSPCMLGEKNLERTEGNLDNSSRHLSQSRVVEFCSNVAVQTENCDKQQHIAIIDTHPTEVMSESNNHVCIPDDSEYDNRENPMKTILPPNVGPMKTDTSVGAKKTGTNFDQIESIIFEDNDCVTNFPHHQNMVSSKTESSFSYLKSHQNSLRKHETKSQNLGYWSKNDGGDKCGVAKNLSVSEYFERKSSLGSKKRSLECDESSSHLELQLASGKGLGDGKIGDSKRMRPDYIAFSSSPCKYCSKPLDLHGPDGNCGTSGGISQLDNVRTYYDPDCFDDIASSAMTKEDEDALERVVAESGVYMYSPQKPAVRDPRLMNADIPRQDCKADNPKRVRFIEGLESPGYRQGSKKRKKVPSEDNFDPACSEEVLSKSNGGLEKCLDSPPVMPSLKIESMMKSPEKSPDDITLITLSNLGKLEVETMEFSEKCRKFLSEVKTCPPVSISHDFPETPVRNDSSVTSVLGLPYINFSRPHTKFHSENSMKKSPCVERTVNLPHVSSPDNNKLVATRRYIMFSPDSPTMSSPSINDVENSRDDVPYSPGSPLSTISFD